MTQAPVLSAGGRRCQREVSNQDFSRVLDRFCQRWATSMTITASAAATMVMATEPVVRYTPATPASTASMIVTSGGVPKAPAATVTDTAWRSVPYATVHGEVPLPQCWARSACC